MGSGSTGDGVSSFSSFRAGRWRTVDDGEGVGICGIVCQVRASKRCVKGCNGSGLFVTAG